MMRAPLALFLAISLSRLLQTVSFSSPSVASARKCVAKHVLFAKKKKKKSGATAGVKGFGTSSKKKDGVTMDRSKDTLNFYDYMEKNGAGDNLKECALGYFTLPSGLQLRGVVALRDIKKGDVIIRIPYEMAVNLGPEGEDPTLPGLELLKDYCETHCVVMAKEHLILNSCHPLWGTTAWEVPTSFPMKHWICFRHH